MADVNKSVEITMRANLKQLEEGLKNIPNMTKKEAQAMTRALASEFNKAQKAAAKAAEESKKAAKATAKAYEETSKKTKSSFEGMADKAKESSDEIKNSFKDAAQETDRLAENAEVLGTSMGAADLAVSRLIPNLDAGAQKALELADGVATAAEQAIKGGPATMALTAATVAGTAAYNLYTKSTRQAAAQQKRLVVAQKAANEKLDEQFNIIKGITADFKSVNREFELLSGKITQLEFDLETARDRSAESMNQELKIQDKRIKEQEKLLKIIDKGRKSTTLLTEQEKEQLNTAMSLIDSKEISAGLSGSEITDQNRLIGLRREALKQLNKEREFSKAIVNRRKEVLQEEEKLIKAKAELAKEEEESDKVLEAREKRKQKQIEDESRLQQIQAVGNVLAQKGLEAQDRGRQLLIGTLSEENELKGIIGEKLILNDRMVKSINDQIQAAQELAQTDEDQAAAAKVKEEGEKTIALLVKERQQIERDGDLQLAELRKKLSEDEERREEKKRANKQKGIDEDIKNLSIQQQVTIGTFQNISSAISQIMKNTGTENKKLTQALFEMNKVAAIGEIAFNTAKAVTAAMAYPPPLSGIMIASAVATGAAQSAAVASQQAPELHMGGMTPDETIAVVKAGEAVLDRSTVDRLGGESGVNRLQNGQGGMPEVIVMNPYKHFDRFMADRQRSGFSTRSARRGY